MGLERIMTKQVGKNFSLELWAFFPGFGGVFFDQCGFFRFSHWKHTRPYAERRLSHLGQAAGN
jgi:hypothetical protein